MTEQGKTDVIANTADLESAVLDFATPEKQQARAFLRERFLRFITGIIGKQAEFHLYENTKVSGEFNGCDVECCEIFVKNLETPIGKLPDAILRNTDIIYFDIGDINTDQ